MNRRIIRVFKALAMAIVAVCVVSGVVYAAWGPATFSGTNVLLWGFGNHDIFIDPKGTFDEFDNQVSLWVSHQDNKVTMVSGAGSAVVSGTPFLSDRAEIAIVRSSGENGMAGMQSSGNARVVVEEGGDVVITLGN